MIRSTWKSLDLHGGNINCLKRWHEARTISINYCHEGLHISQPSSQKNATASILEWPLSREKICFANKCKKVVQDHTPRDNIDSPALTTCNQLPIEIYVLSFQAKPHSLEYRINNRTIESILYFRSQIRRMESIKLQTIRLSFLKKKWFRCRTRQVSRYSWDFFRLSVFVAEFIEVMIHDPPLIWLRLVAFGSLFPHHPTSPVCLFPLPRISLDSHAHAIRI